MKTDTLEYSVLEYVYALIQLSGHSPETVSLCSMFLFISFNVTMM